MLCVTESVYSHQCAHRFIYVLSIHSENRWKSAHIVFAEKHQRRTQLPADCYTVPCNYVTVRLFFNQYCAVCGDFCLFLVHTHTHTTTQRLMATWFLLHPPMLAARYVAVCCMAFSRRSRARFLHYTQQSCCAVVLLQP